MKYKTIGKLVLSGMLAMGAIGVSVAQAKLPRPVLVTPLWNGNVSSVRPTVKWKRDYNASMTRIILKDSTNVRKTHWIMNYNHCVGNTCTYKYPETFKVGTGGLRIRNYKSGEGYGIPYPSWGNSNTFMPINFKEPPPLAKPHLSQPLWRSSITKTEPTVKWFKNPSATRTRIIFKDSLGKVSDKWANTSSACIGNTCSYTFRDTFKAGSGKLRIVHFRNEAPRYGLWYPNSNASSGMPITFITSLPKPHLNAPLWSRTIVKDYPMIRWFKDSSAKGTYVSIKDGAGVIRTKYVSNFGHCHDGFCETRDFVGLHTGSAGLRIWAVDNNGKLGTVYPSNNPKTWMPITIRTPSSATCTSTRGVDLTGYIQKFNDEFTGNSLDKSIWETPGWNWATHNNPNWYNHAGKGNGDNALVYGGRLHLRTTIDNIGTSLNPKYQAQIGYISTSKTGKARREFKYGYFETCMRVTNAEGTQPAWWLSDRRHDWNPTTRYYASSFPSNKRKLLPANSTAAIGRHQYSYSNLLNVTDYMVLRRVDGRKFVVSTADYEDVRDANISNIASGKSGMELDIIEATPHGEYAGVWAPTTRTIHTQLTNELGATNHLRIDKPNNANGYPGVRVRDGKWHRVATLWNSKHVYIYIDGRLAHVIGDVNGVIHRGHRGAIWQLMNTIKTSVDLNGDEKHENYPEEDFTTRDNTRVSTSTEFLILSNEMGSWSMDIPSVVKDQYDRNTQRDKWNHNVLSYYLNKTGINPNNFMSEVEIDYVRVFQKR